MTGKVTMARSVKCGGLMRNRSVLKSCQRKSAQMMN